MTTTAEKLIIWATRASVLVAITLLCLKLYAWFATGALGILAALVDSLLDLCASMINLIAVKYALEPADEEHRFGHGKAESLAGLGQALFIGGSALFLIIYSIERVVNPELISSPEMGTYVMLVSMLLTLLLVVFQRYVVRVTGSVAIKADSLHYSSDLITNAGVILGLVLYYAGYLYADPIIALLIGVYILKCAYDIAFEATQLLLDRELPEEQQEEILKLASGVEGILEVHDLRTRRSGSTRFIQLHTVMDGNMSLIAAHELSEKVLKRLARAFPDADIIIHQDPHTESIKKE